jgi:DNA repair exonuclease SbcCD ATPase subunit
MINTIADARRNYEQQLGRRKLYIEQKEKFQKELSASSRMYDLTVKARTVVQIVAKKTQEKIELYISNLVTMALAWVFPEPYEFQLRFVERRNSTEADFIFKKNGHEIDDILSSGGGGVADVADFALRPSLWSLKKTRPIFIDDEPDKYLHSVEYQSRASQMMKMLCEKLGVQIIIVSDQPNIISAADKVIHVNCKNGVSYIEGS